jgi:SAM-dependent methyltransferase
VSDLTHETRPVLDLFHGFALASAIAGLEMAGELSPLDDGGITLDSTRGRADHEADLLVATLRYLVQRGVLREADDRFTLTDYGARVYADRGFLVWLVGGYGEPLRRLDAFLAHGKRYGSDVTRDGRWVAAGTAMMARTDVLPHVMEVLGKTSFSNVLDLGSGNARFLISVCQKFGARGVGVDVDPAAHAAAEEAVAASGMRDRIDLFRGDVRALDQIPGLDRVDLVVTFYLLHEILASGRDALVGYLTDLSRRLPAGAKLLIGEIEPPVAGDPAQPFTPEFAYVHALVRQTLLPATAWSSALTDSGFAVREVVRCRVPGGVLLLCENSRAL